MKTLFRILFFFLLVTQICFAQWYQQTSNTTSKLNAVYFIDINNGFAVGDNGVILRTNNGGNTWVIQSSGTILPLNDISFSDNFNGWIVGGYSSHYSLFDAIVLHTTDSGNSWVTQITMDSSYLFEVVFFDANNGFAVGGGGADGINFSFILKTSNAGVSWISSYDTLGNIRRINFSDPNNGWILCGDPVMWGYWSAIYKTVDGGISWTKKLENQPGGPRINGDPAVLDIYFSDMNNGIAIGGPCCGDIGGIIYRTSNGGNTWIDTLIFNQGPLNSVWFNNQYQGTIVSLDGSILKTTDKGITWDMQTSGTSNLLMDVCFIDEVNGWIVGDSGTILHTNNGGVTFIEEDENNLSHSTEFALSQNYPNPFNPSTVISYQLPVSSKATLKVYDILGREVATLVDEEKPTGGYEIEFKFKVSSHQLASGIYYYQLKAGDFIQTKKMILLK